MSQSPAFCAAVEECLPRSAALVWSVTRPARSALHEKYLVGPCRGPVPFGKDDPAARLPRQACERVGCIDLFMDVWIHAHAAMHARFGETCEVDKAAAIPYLAACARSQLAELNRKQRMARGGIAKPQRKDGTVGRIARSLGDPWLTDLFRFLLGYAGAAGHPAEGWPLDVLTERKNAWDGRGRVVGSAVARAELRQDVESCITAARREEGDGWIYDYLLLPLANRPGQATLPAGLDGALPSVDADSEARLAEAAASVLDDLLHRMRDGASPGTALLAAVDAWLGGDPCPPEWARKRADDLAMRRLAKSLVASLSWDREAA
jgi:hypothetical protein